MNMKIKNMIIDQIETKNIINKIKKNKIINKTLKIYKREITLDVRTHLQINKSTIETDHASILMIDKVLIKIDHLKNHQILIKQSQRETIKKERLGMINIMKEKV